jgi:uncharacterized Zn finger protein
MTTKTPACPDCGCPPRMHNAVNRLPSGELIAHCGDCGACWKTKEHPDFVQAVKDAIDAANAEATRRRSN